MVVSIFFSALSFLTYIYSGLYVFFLDRRSRLHRFFLILCMIFAFWSITHIIAVGTEFSLPPISDLFARLTFLGATLYGIAVFRLFLVMTEYEKKIRRKVLFYALVLLPPAFFGCLSLLGFLQTNNFSNPWYAAFHVYLNVYAMATIVMIIVWGVRSRYRRHKRQAALIVGGAFLVIAIDYVFELVDLPAASSTIIVIWILFVWYAIVKYRFLAITPATVSQDLIDSTEELILFLNTRGEIVIANNAVQRLLNTNGLLHKHISLIVHGEEKLIPELKKLVGAGGGEFVCRCNLRAAKNEKIPAELKFKAMGDRFGDLMGIMIIGRQVRELQQLRAVYKITPRETEIIQKMIAGHTNRQIAADINVSDNTMKRHINNIYNKLGVNNKIELFNLLKEFNLVPSQNVKNILLIHDG